MLVANNWKSYECLDAGDREKLESWDNVVLRRPEPGAIWSIDDYTLWDKADAIYHRSETGGGYWENKTKFKEIWTIKYNDLIFKVSPTGFKHTGLFPEQAVNWDFMYNKIKRCTREIKVLNLFAYTGAATMFCSHAGATEVVHVDASQGMVSWAKENMNLCKLSDSKIRFIVDDCLKFVQRESRRGNKYDAIIMDPPTYGRGPNKELWKFEDNLYTLINACMEVLSDNPLFFLINSYTKGINVTALENIIKTTLGKKYKNGTITCDEIGLPIKRDNLILPCGVFGRWESNE